MSSLHTAPSNEPPSPFRLSSPQVVELREGGGCLAWFGLPFFVAGIVMTLTLFGFLHLSVDSELRGEWAFFWLVAMGLVFTGIGAVLAFGRRWTVIDLGRGLLIRSYGFLVPMRARERPLSEFNAVIVAYDMGGSESPETYPVRLRAVTGLDFVVRKPPKFGESRVLAEYLSGFLRLPLVDTISDHETTAAPGRAAQPLRERLAEGGTDSTPPVRPPTMRSQIVATAGTTTIVIPGGGGLGVHMLGIVLPLAVLLVVFPMLARHLSRPGTPGVAHTALVFFLGLLVVPPILFLSAMLMVRGSRKRTRVIASHTGLEIEQWSGRRSRKEVIAAADLLDVDSSTIDGAIEAIRASSTNAAASAMPSSLRWIQRLRKWVPSKGIIVKSRTEIISFGDGLSASELRYLIWAIRKALGRP